ncbi:MAG: tryptophan 7-halogenase, partial [Pseudomonadales bacterium]|nr:tryptophan 7-halogenase [Pseudomonadales bacterium]
DGIGVLDAIRAAGFKRKLGATMCWGRDSEPWTWYFRETNKRFPHAYQVWRPRFDQILLDHSRSCGVDVHEGTGVKRVLFDGDRATGIELDGGESIRAAMVVDASGQSSLIARQRSRSSETSPSTATSATAPISTHPMTATSSSSPTPTAGCGRFRWPMACPASGRWWIGTSARRRFGLPGCTPSLRTRSRPRHEALRWSATPRSTRRPRRSGTGRTRPRR